MSYEAMFGIKPIVNVRALTDQESTCVASIVALEMIINKEYMFWIKTTSVKTVDALCRTSVNLAVLRAAIQSGCKHKILVEVSGFDMDVADACFRWHSKRPTARDQREHFCTQLEEVLMAAIESKK
jgi:hypothetical protein